MPADIFADLADSGRAFFISAAVAAARELGLFERLRRDGPQELAALAAAVIPGRRAHRLRALVDVLVAAGALARAGEVIAVGAEPASDAPVLAAGWGALAAVIAADAPIASDAATAEHHAALARSGAAPAQELAARLPAGALLDVGGGAGTYTAAYLDAHPGARATLVELPAVAALARVGLARFAARATVIAGDATTLRIADDHAVALLANVLHLHDAATAAALCAAAARAVAPGGQVVVKDLAIDDDRRTPWASLLFALNMALYTDGGDVHPASAIAGWLAEAGLTVAVAPPLAASPGHVILTGRRDRA